MQWAPKLMTRFSSSCRLLYIGCAAAGWLDGWMGGRLRTRKLSSISCGLERCPGGPKCTLGNPCVYYRPHPMAADRYWPVPYLPEERGSQPQLAPILPLSPAGRHRPMNLSTRRAIPARISFTPKMTLSLTRMPPLTHPPRSNCGRHPPHTPQTRPR